MDYPATFEFDAPAKVPRWRIIGNLILGIPHLVVLYVLGNFKLFVSFFSWVVIIFTGRLPQGLANVTCMLIRYSIRVGTYVNFMHKAYPPMDFSTIAADDGKSPATKVSFVPELTDRARFSVLFRFILVIPVLIVYVVYLLLRILLSVAAFFVVLIVGRWPVGMRNVVAGTYRYEIRFSAYLYLLTDKEPPLFRLR